MEDIQYLSVAVICISDLQTAPLTHVASLLQLRNEAQRVKLQVRKRRTRIWTGICPQGTSARLSAPCG